MADYSLLDHWVTIYRRRLVLLTIVVSSVGTAVYLSKTLEPVYEARASFYLPSDVASRSFLSAGPDVDMLAKSVASPLGSDDGYKPYIGILKSWRVAEQVQALYPSKTVEKLLRSDMDFELSDEFILYVYSRDTDPALAADIANAYVDALEDVLREGSDAQTSDDPRVLRTRIDSIETDRIAAESELEDFEQRNRLPALEQELQQLSAIHAEYEKRLSDTRISLSTNQRELEALRRDLAAEGVLLPEASFLISTPLVEELRRNSSELAGRLEGFRVTLGEDHNDVARVTAELAVIQDRLNEEIRAIIQSHAKPASAHVEELRRQVADKVILRERLFAEETAIVPVIESLEQELAAFPKVRMEWARLSSKVTRLRNLETALRLSLEEVELQAERSAQVIVRLRQATPPVKPSFPIWWLNAIVGVLAGLIVGLLYCFFLGYLERTASLRVSRLAREIAG